MTPAPMTTVRGMHAVCPTRTAAPNAVVASLPMDVDASSPGPGTTAPTGGGIVPAHETQPSESGPITTSIVWATWALFVGLGLLLTGAGLFATVVGIRSETDGFPTIAIGSIAAAYYLGFLIGSRITLRALGTVGHIRVYAALASVLSAVILGAGMLVHPASWLVLRLIAGACLAGQYVVAESWLNQLVSNTNRARVLSTYTMSPW